MGAIPGNIETDQQPPMTVPLRHFVVGPRLRRGNRGWDRLTPERRSGTGAARPPPSPVSRVDLYHDHGCDDAVRVPVWSGATLHSRRLANVQLGLVVAGLTGFVVAFLRVETAWLIPFATLMLVGFWAFAYNIIRTLATVGEYDVTERHFLGALGFFLALTVLGLLLAIDFTIPTFSPVGVSRSGVVGLTRRSRSSVPFSRLCTERCTSSERCSRRRNYTGSIITSDRRRDHASDRRGRTRCRSSRGPHRRCAGRGLLVLLAASAICLILARKLYEMRVERTPMHTRYIVAVGALALWIAVSVPAWVSDPLTRGHLLGAANAGHLLLLGAIGFVVVGTLYHIIPFVIWVNRYSDLLGLEDVPMIDDLYDDRIAAIDGALLGSGSALIVGSNLLDVAATPALLGGLLVGIGVMAFVFNMVLVLVRHSPHSIDRIVFGSFSPRRARGLDEAED